MKLAHVIAIGAATGLALIGGATSALAQETPNPQIVTVQTGVACGTVTATLTNNDTGAYTWGYATGPFNGGPIGETGNFEVPAGKTTTKTIKLPEDSFDGHGFVTLQALAGPNKPLQPSSDVPGGVLTDCDGKPPVKYPADCEIGAGVDNGESGKQANEDAPCVSNSPGYERDEVGKQCDVTSGEIGGGKGVVTEALKCEVPAAGGDEGTDPGTDEGAGNGDNGGNDDQGTDNAGTDNGTDNGGSGSGSVDDGLNPGPITSSNGETVTVPSGGVETGGGPA